ncbi:MAG: phosphoglycolate phosphatase [Rhodospirillales bacterium]|nr:phosphoglycolate phosphatase [Rhodospirillales bacterium]
MIKALVFDLDGTLIDSAEDLCAALNRMLADEGLRPLALAEVVPMIGDGAAKLVERALAAAGGGRSGGGLLPELTQRFLAHYEPHAAERTRPIPGAAEALAVLAAEGFALAICTNKPEQATRRILAALGLESYFAAVVGGDSVPGRPKPDPAMVLAAVHRLGVAPDEAVMVGDAPNDVLAARAAGLPVLLRRGGYTAVPAEELGADAVFEDFAELAAAIAALPQAALAP